MSESSDFNQVDWEWERSSGYAGYRNCNKLSPEFGHWIHEVD